MRIATATAYQVAIQNLQDRQVDLTETQVRLTSGKRVLRAGDDPTAAARAERAAAAIDRSTVSQRAVEASRTAMTLAESALGNAVNLVQTARETLVAAGNGSYTAAERKGLAAQLQQIRDQLLSIANQQDGAGNYLFAGQGAAGAPFVSSPSGVQFTGVGGVVSVASGEVLPATVDGQAAWMSAATGNGVFETQRVNVSGAAWIDAGRVTDPALVQDLRYDVTFSVTGGTTTYTIQPRDPNTGTAVGAPSSGTYQSGSAISIDGIAFTITGTPADGDEFRIMPSTPTLSVFDALDRAIEGLRSDSAAPTDVIQTTNDGLRNLDSVLARLQSVRSAVGDTLHRIDGVEDRLSALKLNAQTDRSNAEDLDMVQAISEFQNKQTGYDAVLKTYSMVQRMSLFQYLG
ncbi:MULTISPECIES: flagellar hook-associated protein FlgL [Caldimonas]|uniref:flagellar hook-associated protein FlgL n=1 Tax=Caldimonas TaxID=196013 RepID=UPI00035FB8AF|nr:MULTISPECIES: flagellar hook-associated protein FlgL [Caldimonas]GIX25748.1 MAG: flagellar hook-associated protein FlgL [Caldimonas sp.]